MSANERRRSGDFFMFTYPGTFGVTRRDPALIATATFLDEHASALLNAAALLGGPSAHRRCLRMLSVISQSDSLSQALKRELVWMHKLLTLEYVDDLESEETARFAMLDVLDPRVEEICLEADRLFELLLEIAELHPDCEVVSGEIFDLSAA